MTEKKSVFIVDDHPLFREGLGHLINRSANYEVVGESGNGREAVRLIEAIKPDLVTMDLSLPDMDGIEAIRQIKHNVPDALILIVSMHSSFDYVGEGFRAGAMGYVVKEATSDKLIEAMNTICCGKYYLDGNVSQEVVRNLVTETDDSITDKDERFKLLTPRERESLYLVAQGLTNREIAEKLSISPKTAENHRSKLMNKLGLHDRMALTKYAVKIGLIDMDSWK